MMGKTYMFQHF